MAEEAAASLVGSLKRRLVEQKISSMASKLEGRS